MKTILIGLAALLLTSPVAQSAVAGLVSGAKSTSVTANFQIRLAADPNASTADVTKALAQANQSLGELADRECDVLAAAFKADCHVVQLNLGAQLNDNRRSQFNNDFAGGQRFVNANLNATFELSPHVSAPSDGQPGK